MFRSNQSSTFDKWFVCQLVRFMMQLIINNKKKTKTLNLSMKIIQLSMSVYLCLMLSGTKIFHHECRFWRLYSVGGESATSLIELPFRSSISLSSITDELMLFGFDEFRRRRRSILVCQVEERRRLSFSGVDVNRDCRGEPTTIGGDDDNGDDCVCSFSSLPFAIKS